MPIRVRWNNVAGQECTIRPTPLISIVSELNQTGAGDILGVTYKITLNGKLLPDEGTPYALMNTQQDAVYPTLPANYAPQPVRVGPFGTFDNNISHFGDNRPPRQNLVMVGGDGKEQTQWQNALMMKQRSIRALFANHGQRMEITDVEFDIATVICFPRIVSVSFAESQLTTSCDYTVELEADTLWTYATVDPDGNRDQSRPHTNAIYGLKEINFMTDTANAYIKDFSESWNIEVDESKGEVLSTDNTYIPRSYRVTHNISATGKDHYTPNSTMFGFGADEIRRLKAWEQAKKFVTARLANAPEHRNDTLDPTLGFADRVHNRQVDANSVTPSERQDLGYNVNEGYPNKSSHLPNTQYPASQDVFWPAIGGRIGAGALDLINQYNGFNHTRTESIDETAGSYSVVETWLLASGTAYENYTMSVNTALGDPFIKVSINGNVKGLTQRRANDQEYGGGSNDGDFYSVPNQYENALNHYNNISNNQLFGVGSMIYKRANNQTQVQLNAEPKSVALSVNEFAGEITYALEFDNRPTNIISNTVNETISINDTYPGDVFATIPVIGRTTGPILQYIGGRTEYRRDVAVNLTMDYTKIPYGSGRSPLLLAKPSVNEPTATEIANLLDSLSPANEPGIRKYFISAPTESWEPKTGNYNFNISFTYELDK